MLAFSPSITSQQFRLPEVRRIVAHKECFIASPDALPVSDLGLLETADIKVSRLGCPGRILRPEHGLPRLLHLVRLHIKGISNPRLTDIIHAGPLKVSDNIGKSLHVRPIASQFSRLALRAADHALRMRFVARLVLILEVIVPHNVPVLYKRRRIGIPYPLSEFTVEIDHAVFPQLRRIGHYRLPVFLIVLIIQTAEERAEGAAYRSGGVQGPCKRGKLLRDPISVGQASLFRKLISYGPQEDTGMIAVPQNHAGKLAFPLCLKEIGKIVIVLLHTPYVKRFVNHQHSNLVAGVQHLP